MILANDPPDFNYADGDCGYVQECTHGSVTVQLVRNQRSVKVKSVVREVEQDWPPDGCYDIGDTGPNEVWIVGEIQV
jgi:hypothetical protein